VRADMLLAVSRALGVDAIPTSLSSHVRGDDASP
jgi:hypothetical protein